MYKWVEFQADSVAFRARELEPDNPCDIAAAAKKAVKKLDDAETPIEFAEFYDRYFDDAEPEPVVINACQALIGHPGFEVGCAGSQLSLERGSDIPEYCNLLDDIPDEFYGFVHQDSDEIPPEP